MRIIMKTNRIKQLIREGKPTLGTRIIIPWPRIIEVIGVTGIFDYIEYSAVYSSWDLELLENFSRAFELFPNLASSIKVGPEEREFIVPRAIDAGFQNVKFTEIVTADEVRECIRLVRPDTPEAGGKHGSTLSRRLGGLLDRNGDAWMKALEDVGVHIVVEKKEAVDNLDEILSVPGIDMLSFGGNDYAISIGKSARNESQKTEEEVLDVEEYIAEKAMKKGIPFRVHLHKGFEEAGPWIEMGIRNFFICADLQSIADECRRQGGAMRKLLAAV
jgi:2-keto-3-deoxy-L-rhamnonate aldolase RhmA